MINSNNDIMLQMEVRLGRIIINSCNVQLNERTSWKSQFECNNTPKRIVYSDIFEAPAKCLDEIPVSSVKDIAFIITKMF